MSLWKFLLLKTKNKEGGFTMVLILGLGLFMLITGVAAIKMSSNSEVNSKVQEKTQQSLAAAELGLARIQEILDQNRFMAVYPDCASARTDPDGDGLFDVCPDTTQESWEEFENLVADYTEGAFCIDPNDPSSDPGPDGGLSYASWQDVDDNDPSKGQYRLVSYTYEAKDPGSGTDLPGVGKLIVEGRTNQGVADANASTKAINTGITRLQVEIPIRKNTQEYETNVPGLWMNYYSNVDMGLNKVQGSILVSDEGCQLNGATPNNVTEADNIVAGSGSVITTPGGIPDTPDLPPTNRLNKAYGYELVDPNIAFPRSTDVEYEGAYHYIVPALEEAGGSGINITGNAKIILYVQGNIQLNGSINNRVGMNSDSLQIYGNTNVDTGTGYKGTNYKYGCDDLKCPTTTVHFAGTAEITAFIHAPLASSCVAGGGSGGDVTITGAIWVNAWNVTSGCSGNDQPMIAYDGDSLPDYASAVLGAGQVQTYDEPQISPLTLWDRIQTDQ
jgi:hypothetical protein